MASRIEQAIEKRDPEALRKALAKSRSADQEIESALQWAVHTSDMPTVEFLLDTLNPTIPAFMMHIASDEAVLRLLIAHGADINVPHDDRSDRPLPIHTAAEFGRAKLIPALVELGADVNARDIYGRTPLLSAAREMAQDGADEGMETIEALHDQGADVSLTDYHGNGAIAYYRFACRNERETPDQDAICRLAEMGSPDNKPIFDLFIAIADKDLAAIREAIAQGADVNHISPAPGQTPLESAAYSGTTELVQILLDAGADPNKPGDSGTPLVIAAMCGNLPVVKQLIAAGADVEMQEPSDPEDNERVPRNAYLAADIAREHEVLDYLKSLGSGRPKPKQWKPIEPGVGSWNDFSEILVKADVGRTANALARIIGGRVEMNAYGRSFAPGQRAYVVVRPKGMNWANVFQVAPPMLRWPDAKESAAFAMQLAQAAGTAVMTVEYSDTSDATSIRCYEPGRSVTVDDGWDEDTLQEMADAMADLGEEVPDWAQERLAKADPDNPKPRSTERLVMLAEEEKFAVANLGVYCEPGRPCDVEFTGYPAEAFDGVAFVSDQP